MKAIRKAKVTYAILFLVALVLFLAEKPGTVTYAASKKNGLKNYKTITVEKSQKIKGMVYSMEKNGDGYTVIAAKNGDQKTILSYCDSPAVTTNGKYVYYATGEFQMMSNYPRDVSDIQLPSELCELAEIIAKNVHEVWAAGRLAEGWKYGSERNDMLRTHPGLVPYEELSETEKDYDRRTAMETLKLIQKIGFGIKKVKN